MQIGAALLADLVDEYDDPADRVHAFIRNLAEFAAVGDSAYVSLLIRERQRLASLSPERMETALGPFIDMLEGLLADAGAAGLINPGDRRRDAWTTFNVVMTQIAPPVRGDATSDEVAAYVWRFCWQGLGGEVD